MNLYERDYMRLTPEEVVELNILNEQQIIYIRGDFEIIESFIRHCSKAIRHNLSLFPNNYLDPLDLKEYDLLKYQLMCFRQLLNSQNVKERDILNFINQNSAYFIVASILKRYFHFGHHETYLFPEFLMGNSYKSDYLIVGRSSGGYEFIFVEFESPRTNITHKDGYIGEAFRKGEKQVKSWNNWLQKYYSSLKETFDKSKLYGTILPDEFIHLDLSRIHFVVIAGRRSDFNEITYQIRREENQYRLLHYDNLVDSAEDIIGRETY